MRSLLAALAFIVACDEPLEVAFHDGDAQLARFEVELAETAEERSRGLRGRSLDPGAGLLFVLPGPPQEVCIANDGVDFAIDAVFIADAAVTAVERDIPADDATDRCHRADHILEVLAGEAGIVSEGHLVDLP